MDKDIVVRKRLPTAAGLTSEQFISHARRQGFEVETNKKWGAASNKQHSSNNDIKLEQETEELRHATISLEIGKLIQQGRQAKSMSQKDLATKINEKPQIISEYESGKAIPNHVVLGKIERVLDVKLRGLKGKKFSNKVK